MELQWYTVDLPEAFSFELFRPAGFGNPVKSVKFKLQN